jgi:4-diphosphocytidyl-2-C-methyl-D-erythritol kinase
MVAFPPCKINLGLNIIRKRDDGYHDIETCFYPVPLTDVLEVIPSTSMSFTTSGNLIPGDSNDNLCLRAYHLLQSDFDLSPVSIHLHKIIPTGAGLGGGSADAAYTLRLLRDVFKLDIGDNKLMQYAARIGSDCSFFVQDNPMIGFGRGDVLKPCQPDLQGKYLVVVNPGLHVSTAEAYAGVLPGAPAFSLQEILLRPLEDWKTVLQNDFEKSILGRFPLISRLKEEMYKAGAAYASMSGSGSSVFGIFHEEVTVENTLLESYVIWKGYL